MPVSASFSIMQMRRSTFQLSRLLLLVTSTYRLEWCSFRNCRSSTLQFII